MSHPAWVCGLKPSTGKTLKRKVESHPAWVCGLKLRSNGSDIVFICHTLRGCVD